MLKNRVLRLAAVATVLTGLVGSAGSVRAAHSWSPARIAPHASTTLVYGTTEEPDTLNPLETQLETADNLDSTVFNALVRSDQNDNFVPALATSWKISPDNLTYTFHLRHDVKWADGQPFTAKDVYFTYKQQENPKNNNFSTQGWDHITSVDTPDDYTVVFHTKKVYAPFLTTVGETFILPAHYFEHSASFQKSGNYNHDPFNRTPFGTGPYKVTEWKSADHITLVPNKYYWGPKPYFQKVIFKIVPNVNTMLVQLRTNEVQVGELTQQQVAEAKAIPGKVLVDRPGNAWYHIDLKQWGFLRDQQVRVALDYATPKEEILAKVLHGYGQVDWAGDIAPIVKWAYDPNVPRHPFNLAKARSLLAADGFTKGSDGFLQKGGKELYIQLWYPSDDAPGAQIDTILKYEWGQIGVKVDLHHQDVNTIFGANGPQFTHQMTGVNYSWFNGNDPDDKFYWNSSEIPSSPTGAGGNDVGYFYRFSFQKQIDDLTNAELTTVDRAKRAKIFAQIETILAEQVPVIFLDWQPLLYSAPKNLKGFDPNAFNYALYNLEQWHY